VGYRSWRGVPQPDPNPEAIAIAELMARVRPHLYVDLHIVQCRYDPGRERPFGFAEDDRRLQ